MRALLSRGLWLVVFLVPALVGLSRGEQQGTPDDPAAPLIKQLGAGAFAARQDAGKKLIALGEKAVPALRKAAASDADIEVRRRAEELLLVILPPTRKSKSIGLDMARIDGGAFLMGSPDGEKNRRPDEKQHNVTIKATYYLGIFEVTQGEYQKVMKVNPSTFSATGGGRNSVGDQDTSRFPVENVTWFDAIEFCNQLSNLDELPPYYKIDDAKREGKNLRNASVTIVGGNGYRLPTEAEWEFACRAVTEDPYHFGKAASGKLVNCKSSIIPGGYGGGPAWRSLDVTAPVGGYPANHFKLHDMHGNVAEWCWDYYDKDYYGNSPRVDPPGPVNGTHRVNRGGSWLVTEASCRSASRFMQFPGENTYTVGFRVARNP